MKNVAALDDGIDCMTFLITKEADRVYTFGMGRHFCEFGHQPIFEDGSAQRMGAKVLGGVNADEPSGKAEVGEVDFGSLDEAFLNLGEMGTGEKNDEAGL